MTDSEADEALARLRELHRRINEGVHELLNILAVLKGEVDLAVERARLSVDQFYEQHPEFLEK